jgi:hypothetical protein
MEVLFDVVRGGTSCDGIPMRGMQGLFLQGKLWYRQILAAESKRSHRTKNSPTAKHGQTTDRWLPCDQERLNLKYNDIVLAHSDSESQS